MIVLSNGKKWYSENYTHYEPMSISDFERFERFGRGKYDIAKMALVEHYSIDVCYSYSPVGLNSGIPINQTDYKVIWCFSLTRMVSNEAKCYAGKQHSVYVYLTTEEVKTLYKDPKSIWDKASKWCEIDCDESKEEEGK